jgi:thioesterase domain-containing protein
MFLVASGHGDAIRFKRLARKLDDVCDLSMLQPPLEEERPFNSINDLSARYANLIADEI